MTGNYTVIGHSFLCSYKKVDLPSREYSADKTIIIYPPLKYRTESIIPWSAWKPSFTGNTWSLLSAIVQSWKVQYRIFIKSLTYMSISHWAQLTGSTVVLYTEYCTWVSLKSFTPTQYTEAPSCRDRLACFSVGHENSHVNGTLGLWTYIWKHLGDKDVEV